MSQIKEITDDTFESEVVESTTPVLVDFWAQWCGPCKTIAPILEEIASQFADKLKVVKLDVDANPSTPPKFAVRGIPTLILFVEGQVKASKVGMTIKADLVSFLNSHL